MKITQSGFMFGDPFQIRYLDNFSNSLILLERSFILTFPMVYLAFLYIFDLALVLRARALTNPFPDPSKFYFWFWRYGFHLVQIVKLLWDIQNLINIQSNTLVTTLDLFVFPNIALTTVFLVHRFKQILLTYELFLPERLPSGATMINRRWCYNY